jgi:hypothetical protein
MLLVNKEEEMLTQARKPATLNALPTTDGMLTPINLDHESQPRAIAMTAVCWDERRMVLHLVILAIVVAAALVGAIAS